MDQAAYDILGKLDPPRVHRIKLEDFERDDQQLLNAKQNRSMIEYYFTCTSSLSLYVLNNWPDVDLITYLDADLFFFASPTPLFEELGDGSIAIIGHRFPIHLLYLERFGIFNVGWLSFRRNDDAFACLHWWRERCIEWCYDRVEDGRFADQKYLDDWPIRFKNVVVLDHKGANLAPWNVSNHCLHYNKSGVFVDNQPLIFFHFHGLKTITNWLYDPSWIFYKVSARVRTSVIFRQKIYAFYLKSLIYANTDLFGKADLHLVLCQGRYKLKWEIIEKHSFISVIRRTKSLLRIGLDTLMARYILVLGRHII